MSTFWLGVASPWLIAYALVVVKMTGEAIADKWWWAINWKWKAMANLFPPEGSSDEDCCSGPQTEL